MAFRIDRLIEILGAKRVDRPELQRRTRISSDQMGRILSGERRPGDDKIARIVLALELDADYLLDTDQRYEGMTPVRAAALMALDRYLVHRSHMGEPVDANDAEKLQRVAEEMPEAHLWVDDWKKLHESMPLTAASLRSRTG